METLTFWTTSRPFCALTRDRQFMLDEEVCRWMRFDPKRLAVDYYFGDLQYSKLPAIAADALVDGYDGPALRSLAALANPVASDIFDKDVDSDFREMSVAAPIPEDEARLILAVKSAQKALGEGANVFDQATYIRIHLCKLADPHESLRCLVTLSNEAKIAPRSQWSRIESDLRQEFRRFLVLIRK